ncbi:MAG: pyridoxal-phosphate dependent enzyme [Planctomycetota bacterium]
MPDASLRDQLFDEILRARQRVYAVRPPTPMERVEIGTPAEVWVKREDQPPIHAYKWRGAYNRMATLSHEDLARGVVCASAGNHAQGVAIAARKLGCHATIFMPLPTPLMKRQAVAEHGREHVTIQLVGDTYDQASQAAQDFSASQGTAFVHPYDDLVTMGGQGTIADVVVMSGKGPFDVAYLQIGGGGMAAAMACWLKHYFPDIRIVGVEAEGQASMKAAVEQGGPVPLDELDIFCDGTAVQEAGRLTYPLCRELIDEFVTVSNEQVCSAIRMFWVWRRRIVEPAGALGLAGLLSQKDRLDHQRVLAVTCGANMDFSQLAVIAAEAGIGGVIRRHIRFELGEEPGAMLQLIRAALGDCNIVDFQYGKTNDRQGYPVIGFDAPPEVLAKVHEHCAHAGIAYTDITDHEDVDFRVINYEPGTFRDPLFFRYQFPERPGALLEFLEAIRPMANLCYFNYAYTGERIGRALVGLEFADASQRRALIELLQTDPKLRHQHKALPQAVLERML